MVYVCDFAIQRAPSYRPMANIQLKQAKLISQWIGEGGGRIVIHHHTVIFLFGHILVYRDLLSGIYAAPKYA